MINEVRLMFSPLQWGLRPRTFPGALLGIQYGMD